MYMKSFDIFDISFTRLSQPGLEHFSTFTFVISRFPNTRVSQYSIAQSTSVPDVIRYPEHCGTSRGAMGGSSRWINRDRWSRLAYDIRVTFVVPRSPWLPTRGTFRIFTSENAARSDKSAQCPVDPTRCVFRYTWLISIVFHRTAVHRKNLFTNTRVCRVIHSPVWRVKRTRMRSGCIAVTG